MGLMAKKTAKSPEGENLLGQVNGDDVPLTEVPDDDVPADVPADMPDAETAKKVDDIETDPEYVLLYGKDDGFVGTYRIGVTKPFRIMVNDITFERAGVEHGQAVYRAT